MLLPNSMKGVVLSKAFTVSVQDRPVPTIQDEKDIIMRVHLAGLCGSDLHSYRGHGMPPDYPPFIMGHEAVGEIIAVGSKVEKWKEGDMAISLFSLSCGNCFYCDKNYTSRCDHSVLIGSPTYPGAQAEYLRIIMADASLIPCPTDIPKELCLMLADILPTGYSTAYNARRLADEDRTTWGPGEESVSGEMKKGGVCVVIGCGPVGLCAITSATTLFDKVFATDLQEHRLKAAEKHGAIALPLEQLKPVLLEATDGRGADAALELVGHEGALLTAMELVRKYGVISVGGVHSRKVTLMGDDLYNKNLRFQFGRCSVKPFVPAAVKILRDHRAIFEDFIEHKIGWEDAEEYYRLFERNEVGKTAIIANSEVKAKV